MCLFPFPLFHAETAISQIVSSEINIKINFVYTTWHNLTAVLESIQYQPGKCLNGPYLVGHQNPQEF